MDYVKDFEKNIDPVSKLLMIGTCVFIRGPWRSSSPPPTAIYDPENRVSLDTEPARAGPEPPRLVNFETFSVIYRGLYYSMP